jgi:hypothetical protein
MLGKGAALERPRSRTVKPLAFWSNGRRRRSEANISRHSNVALAAACCLGLLTAESQSRRTPSPDTDRHYKGKVEPLNDTTKEESALRVP